MIVIVAFIAVGNLKFEFEEEQGGIDMCKSIDRNNLRREVTGAIRAFRLEGNSDEDIITKVMSLFNVTREYVLDLLSPQEA
ncbi:MAG: hypothetical protein K5744_07685 [Eubacterium sp.]|nr:hypothetical protein [Eubacterium sp.]